MAARLLESCGMEAAVVHDHHLARLDLAHEGGVYRVEGAGLRGDDVGGLPGKGDEAYAERPEAVGVAQRDHRVRGEDRARVGTGDADEGAAQHLLPAGAVSALDES